MLANRATEYAILGLIHLAKNPNTNVGIEEIAKQEKISSSYLEKVFQKLSEAGIVKPKFGPGGGFSLKKKPDKITIFEIMQIFQLKQMRQCLNFKQKHCSKKFCPLRRTMNEAKKELFAFFKVRTIQNLIK